MQKKIIFALYIHTGNTKLVKFELEYVLNTSVTVLYPRLVTLSGLSDWFADNVEINGDVYTFYWEGSDQSAKVLFKRRERGVRFRWLEDEGEDVYFEFKIHVDELTNELALIIIDFADEDEIDDAKDLWDKQIEKMKRNLGI